MNMLVVRMMISLALGNLLLAAGVMEFVSPCGIILGGVTGLSLTITHYVPLPQSLFFEISMRNFSPTWSCIIRLGGQTVPTPSGPHVLR